MKCLAYFGIGLFVLFITVSCGVQNDPEPFIERLPAEQNSQDDEAEEDDIFTTDQKLYFKDAMEVLGVVSYQCESLEEKEVFSCHTKISEITSQLAEVSDNEVTFNEPGLYLIKKLNAQAKDQIDLIYVAASEKKRSSLISNFKVSGFKDSFYNHIYHFEILPIISKALKSKKDIYHTVFDVQWHISGGRYYFLDAELHYFKKLRPFQKSVIFLEKKPYTILVEMRLNKDEVYKKEFELNLEGQGDIDQPLQAQFELENFDFDINEPVNLLGKVQDDSALYEYKWDVKKIERIECSKTLLSLENNQVADDICGKSYEKTIQLGADYTLDQAGLQQASLVIKKSGRYVIDFLVMDENFQVLARSKRKIILHNK